MRGGTGHHTPVPTPHIWVALPSHLRPLCLSFLLCNVGPPQALLQRVQARVTEAKRSKREPSTRSHSFVTVI